MARIVTAVLLCRVELLHPRGQEDAAPYSSATGRGFPNARGASLPRFARLGVLAALMGPVPEVDRRAPSRARQLAPALV